MSSKLYRLLIRKARAGKWDARMLNGHPDVSKSLHPYIIEGWARGLVVTSTRDGRHAPTSFHPSGRAVDMGVRAGLVGTLLARWRLVRFQRHLHHRHGRQLAELFGPSNRANRKWGKAITLPEGSPLETLHDDHVHIAVA